jgi:polysaccharide biosynthesis transport protein
MIATGELEVVRRGWRDHWANLVRRRWWLMGPLFVCGLAGFAVARFWPRLYRSEALILADQPQVSEQYGNPNPATDTPDRLQLITQETLSRTRLTPLIERFNLYPRDRNHMTMDELVDRMRKQIKIDSVQTAGGMGHLTTFSISFAAESPRLAQQVTEQLTSVLMEQNIADRTQASEGTAGILEKQLEDAREDLDEKGKRQRQFKTQYLGELPEQQQSNLQILNSLESQLHSASEALSQVQQDKVYLESARSEDVAAQQKAVQSSAQASLADGSQTPGTADVALRSLREQLTQLEAKYTPQHPDIIRLKKEIAEWESRKQHVDSPSAPASGAPSSNSGSDQTKGQASIEIDSRLKANAIEIAGYRKDIADLQHRIAGLQSRLSLTPVREQQLSEVDRDYESARTLYQSLLNKKLESELATNSEKRRRGEQLRVLDPASLPGKPSRPDVTLTSIAGWLAGLGLGIGLMSLRVSTLGVLVNEADVSNCTHLPVLVRIPVLRSQREQTTRRWLRALEISVVAVLILGSVGSGIYMYLAI